MKGCPACSVEVLGQYYDDIERTKPAQKLINENGNIAYSFFGYHLLTLSISDDKACSGTLHDPQSQTVQNRFTYDFSTKLLSETNVFTNDVGHTYREIDVADGIQ